MDLLKLTATSLMRRVEEYEERRIGLVPRNISFFHTQEQIINQTKTVTRRLGWKFLKVGDILNACEKCQGLRKGEKIKKFGQIRIVSVGREPLSAITVEDCAREGFPEMTPAQFVEFFCMTMGCTPQTTVTRIEFLHLQRTEQEYSVRE